jgi:hypothetical protein
MKLPEYTRKINRLLQVKASLTNALNYVRRKRKLNAVDLQRIEELKMFSHIVQRQIKDYTIAQNSSTFIAWKTYTKKKRVNI